MGCLGPCLLVASERGATVLARHRTGRWVELASHQSDAAGVMGCRGVADAGFVITAERRQLVSLSDLCRCGHQTDCCSAHKVCTACAAAGKMPSNGLSAASRKHAATAFG